MAVFEFTQSTLHAIYLLNRSYMPYYKWSFRGLNELSYLSKQGLKLEHLISSSNTPEESQQKSKKIEEICTAVSEELKKQGFFDFQSTEMEEIAYAVNDAVGDPNIRNLHILYGV